MSDERNSLKPAVLLASAVRPPEAKPATEQLAASLQALPAPEATPAAEKLDDVEELDFLLEEIENKIAPLALA